MAEPIASPERSVLFLLSDTARLIRRDFDRRARDLGLTRAQWQVLAYLSIYEGINQAGLAERLDIEPITLVRHLDRLEAQDLIERRPDPADRRARTLYLRPAAEKVLETIRALANEMRAAVLEGVSARDEARLVEDLLRIRGNLAASAAGTAPGPRPARAAGAKR